MEPYAALIHTPFWIYDSRFMPETIETLIDTTDIWRIAEQLLGLPEQKLDVKVLTMPTRKFSLARNVYAAQKNRKKLSIRHIALQMAFFCFLREIRGWSYIISVWTHLANITCWTTLSLMAKLYP
jgi:hypothetical protein